LRACTDSSRIIIWIFLLDNAFVIFNNLPPRMVIKEVQSALAWPESVFQAGTAEECLEEIRKWSARAPLLSNMTVRQAIELVCSDGIGEDMHRTLADMGPLNLFVVVSGKPTITRLLVVPDGTVNEPFMLTTSQSPTF
jgi:hypothetical protein